MRSERFVLSDAQWRVIAPLLPGKVSDCGVTARDNRLFFEAVLWRVRTGAPWRDLPAGFGAWNSIFRRFRRWAKTGVFDRVFKALSGEPDFEYVLVDGTIVSVHQKASGAKEPVPAKAGRDSQSGHRSLKGRLDDQDSGAGRCIGQSRALFPLARAASR